MGTPSAAVAPLTTVSELVAQFVASGATPPASAPAVDAAIRAEAQRQGVSLWTVGHRFAPELGGVVESLVERALSDSVLDDLLILGQIVVG